MKSSAKWFLRFIISQKLWSSGTQGHTLCSADAVGDRKSFLHGTSLGGVKGPWRPVGDWHCERPGETTGVGTPSGAGEAPGMKGPRREDGAWNHGTWSEYPEIAQGRMLVKVQQRHQNLGDDWTMGRPPRAATAVK